LNDAADGIWVAYGRLDPDGDHQIVPASTWPFMSVDLELNSTTGSASYKDLRCAFTAEIADNAGVANAIQSTQSIQRTGAAGRPSSMSLVRDEFTRRVDDANIAGTLAAQARILERWVADNHPRAPHPTAKTIETGIRRLYNRARAPKVTAPK
jgi:hypothetical protein